MGVRKESIGKFLIGNRFHVKLRILSPYSVESAVSNIIKYYKYQILSKYEQSTDLFK